jgi:hypothetical protein
VNIFEKNDWTYAELIEMCDDIIKRYPTSHTITDTAVIVAQELKKELNRPIPG